LSAYPNPFTHNTVVEFVVRSSQFVDEELTSIRIHDAAGRLVKTLVNEAKESGRHEVTWNATGVHSQDGCATGIYFARLSVGKDHRETKKLILVR
jgi:flagellar hook assembly protein FlgD